MKTIAVRAVVNVDDDDSVATKHLQVHGACRPEAAVNHDTSDSAVHVISRLDGRSFDLDNNIVRRRQRRSSSADAEGDENTNGSNSYRPYETNGVVEYDWQVRLRGRV